MSSGDLPPAPLVAVRHYHGLAEAREAALALAAKGLSYEIDPSGDGWVLLVEERFISPALDELRAFEGEAKAPPEASPAPLEPIRWEPLFAAGFIMFVFFELQEKFGDRWTRAGVADNAAI